MTDKSYSKILGLFFLAFGGCMSDTSPRPNPGATDGAWQTVVARTGMAARRTLDSITPEQHRAPAPWDWSTTIPLDVDRAELLRPELDEDALAHLLPKAIGSETIRQAGARPRQRLLAAIDGRPITNCEQLHGLAEGVSRQGKNVRVQLQESTASGDASAPTIELTPLELRTICQLAGSHRGSYRVTENGNPWVVIRQDGIRCKTMVRVERSRGLLHVAVSLGTCWGPPVLLPADVRAACDGVPLRCLTAPETLEMLYGTGETAPRLVNTDNESFARVSEQECYLIPTNYKKLEEQSRQAERFLPGPSRQPAFVSIPGVAYPGPAVLGDARALSGCLLQRRHYQPGEPEQVGWVLFAHPTLRQAGTVQIMLDLGQGPILLRFRLAQADG